MTRSQQLAVIAGTVLVAATSTWVLRSHYLIGWDAANFAFALDKIDIGAHRPHPPGYLGYVFAGRALRPFFGDANAALTAWNVLIKSVAGVLLMLLTLTATGGSARASIAAVSILLTSPLLWYYSSNAEIYPTEMTIALAVAYAASQVLNGRGRAVYWMAAVMGIAAMFKVSAMILLGPLALVAWLSAPPGTRWPGAALYVVIAGAILGLFFYVQPDFLHLIWDQFSAATGRSRLGGGADFGLTFNRNVRNTFVSLTAAMGVVNAVAFIVWLVKDRRLPETIDYRVVLWWAAPWLVLLILVHIGNAGYVLPLLPLGALIVAAFYARQSDWLFVTLVALQVGVNIAHIGWLPPPVNTPGLRYRDQTLIGRAIRDLQPLGFPTLKYVRRSDAAIDQLLATASDCSQGAWVVVGGDAEPVDWRRTSYYLPNATAIRLHPDGRPEHVTHGADYTLVNGVIPIGSPCGLLWMTTANSESGLPAGGRHLDGFGWVFGPGTGEVSPGGTTWLEAEPNR